MRGRRAAGKKEVISLSQNETTTPTKFVGYDTLETNAKIVEVVKVKNKTVAHSLTRSVFYAEMGGQVGDTGEMVVDESIWEIVNTQKSGNTFLHFETESILFYWSFVAAPIPGLEGCSPRNLPSKAHS